MQALGADSKRPRATSLEGSGSDGTDILIPALSKGSQHSPESPSPITHGSGEASPSLQHPSPTL